jgi:hypothetical protein
VRQEALSNPPPECALLARARSLTVQKGAQTAMAVLLPTSHTVVVECLADVPSYANFRVGCARSCLENQREAAQALVAAQMPNTVWYARLGWTLYFISPTIWHMFFPGAVPYTFPYYYDASAPEAALTTLSDTTTALMPTTTPAPALAVVEPRDACDARCAWGVGVKTFRYDPVAAHASELQTLNQVLSSILGNRFPVCVPCDARVGGVPLSFGTSVCYLYDPPRHFNSEVCQKGPLDGQDELTADDVCYECALAKEGAELIDFRLDKASWDNWGTVWYSRMGGGYTTARALTNCRYRCAAGYGSNDRGAVEYEKAPCLLCSNFTCDTSDGRARYTTGTGGCGDGGRDNYRPVTLGCQRCDNHYAPAVSGAPPEYHFKQTGAVVSLPGLCPAICNPDLYQTYYTHPTTGTVEFVYPGQGHYYPVMHLKCVRCADANQNFPCAGRCREGFYNASLLGGPLTQGCVACNASRCPVEGQYRAACPAGVAIADAPCLSRLPERLRNPPALPPSSIDASHPAYAALLASVHQPTRRWLTPDEHNASQPWWLIAEPSPVPDQVALVCRNNYAWIDARTGRSPWLNRSNSMAPLPLDPAAFFCVDCTLLNVDGTDRRLYSMWNASNASTPYATPVLDAFSVWGGCYACDGVRDVDPVGGQTLCELPAGYSSQDAFYEQTLFIEVTIPGSQSLLLNDNAQPSEELRVLRSGLEEGAVVFLLDPLGTEPSNSSTTRRRRLLQASSATTTAGVVTITEDDLVFFDAAAPATTRLLLPARRLPLLKNGAYYSCCDTLPSAEDAAMCRALQGTRALNRLAYTGDAQGPCATRPPRRRRRLLQENKEDPRCAIGTFKPQRGDAPCAICPTGATTSDVAVTSASGCQCLPGYAASGGGCTPCPNGTYRGATDRGACRPCPTNQVTLGEGAAACVCRPGTFYARMARQCLECLANHHCADGALTPCPLHGLSPSGSASLADCVCDPRGFYGDLSLQPNGACYPMTPGLNPNGTCARGWTPARVDGQWLQCASGCGAGTYARVDPRTRALLACAPCPADTYAVDGTLVDACTSCPIGRGTAGRTGQTTPDACRCLAGVGGANSTDCAGCGARFYFDPLQRACLACPDGWVSPANSVGVGACQCPPGAYASGNACAPCPIGTYSHAMGLTCTPCPKGCTTSARGQTAYAACYCGQIGG